MRQYHSMRGKLERASEKKYDKSRCMETASLVVVSKRGSPYFDEDLYFKPADFLNAFLKDLRDCKESVDIEMYIWANDKLTEKIEDRLLELAHRGVTVRLLVDAIGSYGWIRRKMPQLRQSGILV